MTKIITHDMAGNITGFYTAHGLPSEEVVFAEAIAGPSLDVSTDTSLMDRLTSMVVTNGALVEKPS